MRSIWKGLAGLALSLVAVVSLADTETVDGVVWTYVIKDGKASVGGGPSGQTAVPQSTTGDLTIPTMLGGCPVTGIGTYAFCYCTGLAKVMIPEGVTNIGNSAFHDCHGLTKVVIPTSVTDIGTYAFRDCWCLTSVTIPEGVTRIGSWAFNSCRGLISVTITEGVRKIESHAFSDCSGLTSVEIPSSVAEIASSAFSNCSKAMNITVADGNTSFCSSDGILYNKSMSTLIQCPGGKSGSVTIPSSVTAIANSAFYGCGGLTSVTIPEGVTNIADWAFNECNGLTSVTIPSSVTGIGARAFGKCYGLTSVTIPEGVTKIANTAFDGCGGLTSVTIPSSVTVIGVGPFADCDKLMDINVADGNASFCSSDGILYNKSMSTLVQYPGGKSGSVMIPESVTVIGGYAFYGCNGLMSMTISSSVTEIGAFAFSSCNSLKIVYVEKGDEQRVKGLIGGSGYNTSGLTFAEIVDQDGTYTETVDGVEWTYVVKGGEASVGGGTSGQTAVAKTTTGALTVPTMLGGCPVAEIASYAFYRCANLSSVKIPDGVTSIGDSAFENCSALSSMTIPGGVAKVSQTMFSGCSSLRSVSIPESVTVIGHSAFCDCVNLTSITIPDGVTLIDNYAFDGCSLSTLSIPKNVGKFGTGAVSACRTLKMLDLDVANTNFVMRNGLICSPDGTTVLQGPGGIEIVTIPDGVRSVKEYAFIESSVKSVAFPGSMISLGYSAFTFCSALKAVNLNDGLEVLGDDAFCLSGVESLVIPATVTNIGEGAFSGCSRLKAVCFKGNAPSGCKWLYGNTNGYSVPAINYVVLGSLNWNGVPESAEIPETWPVGDSYARPIVAVPAELTVTFGLAGHGTRTGGGELEQKVAAFDAAVAPEVSAEDGWIFSGWSASNVFECVVTDAVVTARYSRSASVEIGGKTFNPDAMPVPPEAGDDGENETGVRNVTKAYDGKATNVSVRVTAPAEGAVVSFRAGDDGEWTAADSFAGFTDAGTNKVWYLVSATGYAAVSNYAWVVINPRPVEVEIVGNTNSGSYTGYPHCVTGYEVKFEDELYDEDWISFTGTCVVERTEVGLYDMGLVDADFSNMNANFEVTFTVTDGWLEIAMAAVRLASPDEAPIDEPWVGARDVVKTYDGLGTNIEVSCGNLMPEGVEATVRYSTDRETWYDWADLQFTNVCENLEVFFAFSAPNYLSVTNSARLTILPLADGVYTQTVDGVEWTYVVKNGEASVGGGSLTYTAVPKSTSGAITIPTALGGCPVTSVGMQAFCRCSALTSVVVQPGVKSINGFAFDGCTSLESVSLPEGLEYVGYLNVFCACSSLKSIVIPSTVTTLDDLTFQACTSLTSVTIPAGVKTLGDGVFAGCTSLAEIRLDGNTNFTIRAGLLCSQDGKTVLQCPGALASVDIPDDVTCLAGFSFDGCPRLHELVLPTSLESIGYGAIGECPIATLHVPANVSKIDGYQFAGCNSLTNFTVDAGNLWFSSANGLLYDKAGTMLVHCPRGVSEVTIPSTVTNIRGNALSYCYFLKTVYVEKGDGPRVKGLMEGSGFNTSATTFVEITESKPDGTYTETVDGVEWTYVVKGGEASVGGGTSGQTAVPKSTTGYLTVPTMLGGCPVTAIGDRAFENCSGLTSVVVPEGVLSISDCAFQYCASLASVSLPSTLENIGSSVFSYCQDLQDIRVASGNADYKIQNGCLLTADGTELIRAPVADTVDIPDGVLMIDEAFCGMNETFKCVRIPSSVEIVGLASFAECVGLTNVVIPASVSSIGLNVFSGDSALVSIEVDPANVQYASVDGALYTADKTELISAPHTMVEFAVLPTVTNIWERAFSGSRALASVVIPASVTSIGYLTFEGCASLTSAVFEGNAPILVSEGIYCGAPNAITYVQPGSTGWQTSGGLPEMWPVGDYWARPIHYTIKPDGTYTETVDGWTWTFFIREGKATLGGPDEDYDLYWKAAVSPRPEADDDIVIPATLGGCPVVAIGHEAFIGQSFRSIRIPATVTDCGLIDQAYIDEYVVDADNPNYCSVDGHLYNKDRSLLVKCSVSAEELLIHDGVVEIGVGACMGSRATNTVLSASVKILGADAFCWAHSLARITLPEGLVEIGYCAFWECNGLQAVRIPASVTQIGDKAFSLCDSLVDLTVAPGNARYCVVDGALYTKDMSELLRCSPLDVECIVPESVSRLGGSCFAPVSVYDTVLTSVHFRGNAPVADRETFYCAPDDLTCYAREGSVGWVDMKSTALPETWPEVDGRKIMRWEGEPPLTHAVTFDLGEYGTRIGGGELEQTVVGGQAAVAPTVLSSGGMAFDSWDVDFSFVTEDLTVRALYANPDVFGDGTYSVVTNGCAWTFVIADGEATIVECGAAPVGHLDIPGVLGGCPVVALGESLFDNGVRPTPDFESVTIAASVVRIGDRAFYGCPALKYVTYAGDVDEIKFGEDVFAGTPYGNGWAEPVLEIENGEVVGYASVHGVHGCLTNGVMVIPGDVASVRAGALREMEGLVELVVPANVKSIGDFAFAGCSDLATVTFADREGCSVCETAFDGTPWKLARTLTFGPGLVSTFSMGDGVCAVATERAVIAGVAGATWSDFANVPYRGNGYDEVESCLCLTCGGITDVEKTEKVDFDDYACWELPKINMAYWGGYVAKGDYPTEDDVADAYRANGCRDEVFAWLNVPTNRLDEAKFEGAFEVNEFIVRHLKDGNALVELTTSISAHGITCCGYVCDESRELWEPGYLTGLFIVDSDNDMHVNGGGSGAPNRITYCPVRWIADGAFASYEIGNVWGLEWDAFRPRLALWAKDVPIEPQMFVPFDFEIHDATVAGFHGELPSHVVLPREVVSVGTSAFDSLVHNVGTLTSIALPEGVAAIGAYAFWGCESLTTVGIPASLKTISEGAFEFCPSLTTVYVAPGDGDRIRELLEKSASDVDVSKIAFVEAEHPELTAARLEWAKEDAINAIEAAAGSPSGRNAALEALVRDAESVVLAATTPEEAEAAGNAGVSRIEDFLNEVECSLTGVIANFDMYESVQVGFRRITAVGTEVWTEVAANGTYVAELSSGDWQVTVQAVRKDGVSYTTTEALTITERTAVFDLTLPADEYLGSARVELTDAGQYANVGVGGLSTVAQRAATDARKSVAYMLSVVDLEIEEEVVNAPRRLMSAVPVASKSPSRAELLALREAALAANSGSERQVSILGLSLSRSEDAGDSWTSVDKLEDETVEVIIPLEFDEKADFTIMRSTGGEIDSIRQIVDNGLNPQETGGDEGFRVEPGKVVLQVSRFAVFAIVSGAPRGLLHPDGDGEFVVPAVAVSYEGVLLREGVFAGTLTATVSKPNVKKGSVADVSLKVKTLEKDSCTFKAKKIALPGSEGVFALEPTNKKAEALGTATIAIGGDSLTGAFANGLEIDAVRDVFKAKGEPKRDRISRYVQGGRSWCIALATDDPGFGYAVLGAKVQTSGKVSVTGHMGDGIAVTASAKAEVGQGWIAVPFMVNKKSGGKTKTFGCRLSFDEASGKVGVANASDYSGATFLLAGAGLPELTKEEVRAATVSVEGGDRLPSRPNLVKLTYKETAGVIGGTVTWHDVAGKKKLTGKVYGVAVGRQGFGEVVVKDVGAFRFTLVLR